MAARRPRRRRIAAGIATGALILGVLGWATLRSWMPDGGDESASDALLAGRPYVQDLMVQGRVAAMERDLLGRPSKVAIVSLQEGLIVETAIEDEAAGEALKEHAGEDVTATGVVKLKADGTASFVVASFRVHPDGD